MFRADFMGFPFRQDLLMKGDWGNLQMEPEFNLDFCHMTCAPPYMRDTRAILAELARFKALIDLQAREQPISILYGLQNPPEKACAKALADLKEAGVSITTIAFEMENEYGGGFAVPDAPLTGEGARFLELLSLADIALDLSHAGHTTARDALQFLEERELGVPVVATHACCYEVYDHLRNLPDDVLRGIRAQGGIFGLATFSWMLAEEGNELSAFYRHLEHALGVMGEDAVCLGTDGVYAHIDEVEGAKRFVLLNEKLDPRGNYRARWPERARELNTPRQHQVLTEGIEREFGAEIAEKVGGENLRRFLKL